MGPVRTKHDLFDMVRRRARLLLIAASAGIVFSVLLGLSQPRLYQSTAVIQIAQPVIASDATHTSTFRFSQIKQRLMTRRNMLEVIEAFNLYVEFPDAAPDEMVGWLRQSVQFGGLVGATENHDGGSVLSVTAKMENAFLAQLVAHEFAKRFVRLGTTGLFEQSREALASITAQQARLNAQITALKDQIAALGQTRDSAAAKDVLATLEGQLQQMRRLAEVTATYRAKAELAFTLQAEVRGKWLNVIDPAWVPDYPVIDNRRQVALLGSVLSIALAFALAFIFELGKPVIRTAQQMEREIGFGPMASIPHFDPTPPKVTVWQRYQNWLDGPATSDANSV
jgi:uncharacterized protein involved in exopolysaccharide biosynthesis